MSSSADVVKTVSKKLKYYFEVKRLEDGFDLSGPYQPILDHPPLKTRPTLQYDGLHDRPLKHYFSKAEVRQNLTHLKSGAPKEKREKNVRKMVNRYMKRYQFVFNNVPEYYYENTKKGRRLRAEATAFGFPMKKDKKPFKGGTLLLRSAPPKNLSNAEAQRLVNAATKLLVATETVDLQSETKNKDKKGPYLQETYKKLPQIGPPATMDGYAWERSKMSKQHRKFFVYDLDGRRHLVKGKGQNEKEDERDSAYSPTPYSSNIYLTIEGDEARDEQVPRWLKSEMDRTDARSSHEWIRPQSAYASTSSRTSSEDQESTPTPRRPHSAIVERPGSAVRRGDRKRSTTPSDLTIDSQVEPVTLEDTAVQTSRELLVDYDMLDQPLKSGKTANYEVHIFTGTRLGAATKADVNISIHGDNGKAPEVLLKESRNHKIKFQKGQEDIFDIKTYLVGPVRKITIGHSRTELGYGWYLEKVIVHDLDNKKTYVVPCQRWLSSREEDGKTVREFFVELSADYVKEPEKSHVPAEVDPNLKIISYEKATDTEDSRSMSKADYKSSNTSLLTNPSEGGGQQSFVESSSSSTYDSDSDSSYSDSDTEVDERDVTRLGTFTDTTRPDSDINVTVTQKKPDPEPEKTLMSRSRDVTRLGSRREGDKKTMSPLRRDDFFDQKPAGRDYSFVSDSVSQSTDRDNKSDFESDKPLYSSRGDENKPMRLVKEESEEDQDTAVLKKKVKDTNDESQDQGKEFMDGFKAGLEAAKKSDTSSQSTESDATEEREQILNGPTVHQAAKTGDLDRIKKLVEYKPELKNASDERGWTPLHTAANQGNLEVVKWLSVNCSNLEAETPTGYTPMHVAALNGHTDCLMVLAAMGSKVGCTSIDHQTPLHLASMSGHLEAVKWLVANRAVLDVADNLGRIPLDLAEEYGHREVVECLKSCTEETNNPTSRFSLLRSKDSSTSGSSSYDTSESESGSQSARESLSDEKVYKATAQKKVTIPEEAEEEETVKTKKDEENLMEKKKLYEEQQLKMSREGTSFLDSIRAEYN